MLLFKLASQSETPFFKAIPNHSMLISPDRAAGVRLAVPRLLCPASISPRCRCWPTSAHPELPAAKALLTHLSGPSLGPEQVSENTGTEAGGD